MFGPLIYLSKTDAAAILGFTAPTFSRVRAIVAPNATGKDGVCLQHLLLEFPIRVTEDEFERRVGAGLAFDGEAHVDAVTVARNQALYALHVGDIGKAPRLRLARVQEAHAAAHAPPPAPEALPTPVADRSAALADARLEKLRAEIAGRTLKTQRESGELVAKAEVVRSMKAAGAIVQASLGLLPGRLAELVDPAERPEVMRQAEAVIERCLYAIVTALGETNDEAG